MKNLPRPLIILIGFLDTIVCCWFMLLLVGIVIYFVTPEFAKLLGPWDPFNLPQSPTKLPFYIGYYVMNVTVLVWIMRDRLIYYRQILRVKEGFHQ